LIRGIVALLLGIVLILIPISGKHLLIRYMGIFWLASGASSLRWGLHGARATRLWLLAGIVGVLGGLVLIFHQGLANFVELVFLFQLFALVAILTDLLHILGGYRIRQEHGRQWAWGDFFLGLVQIHHGCADPFIPSGSSTRFGLCSHNMGINRRYRVYYGRHQAEETSPCDQMTCRVEILGDGVPVLGGVNSLFFVMIENQRYSRRPRRRYLLFRIPSFLISVF